MFLVKMFSNYKLIQQTLASCLVFHQQLPSLRLPHEYHTNNMFWKIRKFLFLFHIKNVTISAVWWIIKIILTVTRCQLTHRVNSSTEVLQHAVNYTAECWTRDVCDHYQRLLILQTFFSFNWKTDEHFPRQSTTIFMGDQNAIVWLMRCCCSANAWLMMFLRCFVTKI